MELKNNRETLKLELHFEKSEYLSMTEAQKSKLKGAFLWSNYGSCWVSRTKYPNHYHAERIARELGATGEIENIGEKLTYAERLENQAERAEARADRYEGYSANAEKRAESLQSDFNKYRKDIAWLTQPIIAGHSGSRAFANHRQRVMDRYNKGFEEYKKSEYYQDRAATARATANQAQLQRPDYLERRIRECNSSIKKCQANIVEYENKLYDIQNGKQLTNYKGQIISAEAVEKWIERQLEYYDFEQDKLNFFEDCLNALGGIKYSQENIKPGYVVKIRGDAHTVIKTNPTKVIAKSSYFIPLDYLYSEIQKIISTEEEKTNTDPQPFKTGEIMVSRYPARNEINKAFQIIAHTDKTVKLQQIKLVNDIPQANDFISEPVTRKPGVSKFSGQWSLYNEKWQLHKYTA